MTAIDHLSRYRGTFRPRRTDDLRDGADQYIGQELTWQALWVIDEYDSIEYAGEWAMAPQGPAGGVFQWAPSGDVQITSEGAA